MGGGFQKKGPLYFLSLEFFSQLGLHDWCRRSPQFPAWEIFTTTSHEPFLTQTRQLFEEAVTRMLRPFSLT
jgi:hypothetical protein